MPANVKVSGAHAGSSDGGVVPCGLAAMQIGRHRDVHQLRMRQAQVAHVADEIALADLAAQPRIEAALLLDGRHREPAVIVRGIEQA